jgi:hypothetical protein
MNIGRRDNFAELSSLLAKEGPPDPGAVEEVETIQLSELESR